MAGSGRRPSSRPRGSIEQLPSGALRVVVYTGFDPLTGRRHYFREIVPAGPSAEGEAEKVMRRLAAQVDERGTRAPARPSTSCSTATWRRSTSA